MIKKSGIILVLFSFSLFTQASDIAIIGVSNSGKVIIDEASTQTYVTAISSYKKQVDESIASQISHTKFNPFSMSLKKFSVGLGAGAEIGLGPFKLGAGLKHRLFYER